MDLSDEEPQRPKRPVFKKAKKAKSASANKALKRVFEDEVGDVSVSTVNTGETTAKSKNMLKILRYRSLTKNEPQEDEDSQSQADLSKEIPSIEPEAVVVENTTASIENKAYTVVELPNASKTFSLRESHFREKPVELENEYGSEDEVANRVAANDDSDQEMDVPNVDYTVSAPQADPDRYFTEIPMDEEMEDVKVLQNPASVAEYIAQAREKNLEYQQRVESGKLALEMSQWRLKQMQDRKEQLLQQIRLASVLEDGDAGFGKVEAFVRDLYRQSAQEEETQRPVLEEVDMMLLYV